VAARSPRVARGASAPPDSGQPAAAGGADAAIAGLMSIVALAVPLAVYVTTLARGPSWGDSTELALAASTLSIPHPTGYPLYVLAAHTASLVPVGDLPFRIGLFSAVCVAAAVMVMYRALLLATGRIAPAMAAALSFAFWHEVWQQATLPEVYALHLVFVGTVLWATLRLLAAPTPRALAALAFVVGLSFANHMQTVFLVPGIAAALACARAARRLLLAPAAAAAALAAVALPLTLYAALALLAARQPLFDEGLVTSAARLVDHVRGKQFAYRMFANPDPDWLGKEVRRLAAEVATQAASHWALGLPVALLALVGLASAASGRAPLSPAPPPAAGAPLAAYLIASGLAAALYTANYNIPDKGAYYLTIHAGIAVCLAFACAAIGGATRPPWGPPWVRRSLLVAVAALPFAANLGRCDRSRDTSLADYTADIARLAPPRALVITDDLTLWWGFLYRRVVLARDADRAFVASYPLRLPWYLPFLRRLYPDLVLPPELDRRQRDALARIEEHGDAQGTLSQALVEDLTFAIVAANLPHREVQIVLHQTSEPLTTWGPYHVEPLGLTYRVHDRPVPARPYAADYADPARHRVDDLADRDAIRVARRYSTSLNRLGILLIGDKRLAEAEAAFRRALRYEPRYAQAYCNLGVMYSGPMNAPDKAYEAYRAFLDLAPADPQAAAVRSWLTDYQLRVVGRR
jgi:tetratricopeptide (TPR) repeat protein